MRQSLLSRLISLSMLSAAVLIQAQAAEPQTSNNTPGVASAKLPGPLVKYLLRYRLEAVDQQELPENALANTLLARISLEQGLGSNWLALVETDYVTELVDKDYNDSLNGLSRYPGVADPAGADLNQLYLQYQQPGQQLKIGRQRINLHNERFVGGVGWRQNEQTFDAVRYQAGLWSDLSLDYSFSNKINRIFGSKSPQGDWQADLHLLNLQYQPQSTGQAGHTIKWALFVYQMDFASAPAVLSQTAATPGALASNLSYGLDVNMQQLLPGTSQLYQLYAAVARQQDSGDNPNQYNSKFWTLEATVLLSQPQGQGLWQLGAGIEHLGSDNNIGFATPLATLHKFQGFADKFLTTPAQGIEDKYLKLGYKMQAFDAMLKYHWFDAAKGPQQYGKEFDVQLGYQLDQHHHVMLKYAAYQADDLYQNTDKFWLMWLMKY